MEGVGLAFGKGLISAIIIICLLSIFIVFGGYKLIDWLFIDDAIKVEEPIQPEIELIIKDNIVDTIYVYKKP